MSVLQTKTKPTGQGMAELALVNSSGTTVAQLYVAPSESVDRAREAGAQPGSEADKTLWGSDQLGNASIGEGSTWLALQLPPALYDVLLIATDRREQLVKRLRLQAGGKYVLQIGDAWKRGRD